MADTGGEKEMTSKNNTSSSSSSGIGFGGLLTVVFITLKLCKIIAWSWWWVFAPLWIPIILFLLFVAALLFVALVVGGINSKPKETFEPRAGKTLGL